MAASPAPQKPAGNWLLRRTEQGVAAVLTAAGVAALVAWSIYHSGSQSRTIEIEKAQPQSAQFQVDINKAQWPELATLPGVGRKLAERIVESRQENGPFADLDELRRVRGIGPRTLESLRPYLRPMPSRQAVAGP
jgi:competence ComEA-like helix-hairpin-helix protein